MSVKNTILFCFVLIFSSRLVGLNCSEKIIQKGKIENIEIKSATELAKWLYGRPFSGLEKSELMIGYYQDPNWYHAIEMDPFLSPNSRISSYTPMFGLGLNEDVRTILTLDSIPTSADFKPTQELYANQFGSYLTQVGMHSYSIFLENIIEFTQKNFHERRDHWPQPFLDKLKISTESLWWASTYINARDRVYQRKNQGVVRVIRAAYQKAANICKADEIYFVNATDERHYFYTANFGPIVNRFYRPNKSPYLTDPAFHSIEYLPMEAYLGIHLPRPTHHGAGQIFEIGNLAIDKNLSKNVRDEIYIELFLGLLKAVYSGGFSKDFHLNGQAYYAYADEASLHLYLPLGFEKMTQKSIRRDGIDWWPLRMQGGGLLQLRKRLPKLKGFTKEQTQRLNAFQLF